MAALKINRTDFILALTSNAGDWDEAWFLDKETGELWLNSDGVDEVPDDLEDNPRYLPIEAMASHDAFQIMKTLSMNWAIARKPRAVGWVERQRYPALMASSWVSLSFNPAYFHKRRFSLLSFSRHWKA